MGREVSKGNLNLKQLEILKCLLSTSQANQELLQQMLEEMSNDDNFQENLWELSDGTILVRTTVMDDDGNLTITFNNLDGSPYTGDTSTAIPYVRQILTSVSDVWVDCTHYQVITLIDHDTKQQVAVLYRNPLNGNLIPALPSGSIQEKPCVVIDSGLDLVEDLGNGSYNTAFEANYIRVSYLPDDITITQPIIVTLNGTIAGNKSFKVYPQTNEAFAFNDKVILGYEIAGAIENKVDVEIKK